MSDFAQSGSNTCTAAYDGAKAEANAATTEAARRWHRQVAAEELRHHKGFVTRLEALGADPERGHEGVALPDRIGPLRLAG